MGCREGRREEGRERGGEARGGPADREVSRLPLPCSPSCSKETRGGLALTHRAHRPSCCPVAVEQGTLVKELSWRQQPTALAPKLGFTAFSLAGLGSGSAPGALSGH